jgi:AraC-like DNA-binding protein
MFEETKEDAVSIGSLVSGHPRWFHPAIRRALRYALENLTEPRSFGEIVTVAGVSPSRFCALSQHTFGMSELSPFDPSDEGR